MSGFEENEISKNANGGTELTKRLLASSIPPDLLENFQIIASRVRDLDPTKIRIFWANDVAEDPESKHFQDANFRNKFHMIIYTSHWLQQRYQLIHGVPYERKSQVIETAVNPIEASDIKFTGAEFDKDNPIRITYTSTPSRGLSILIPCFEKLQEKYGDSIHLDVFSSFKIYGWDEMDKQYEPLYDQCRNNPGITYHGFQPHDEVIKYLGASAHILGYPCIWPETSCRAVIEAMSAKVLCVHPNYAALPETTGSQNLMYCSDQDMQQHANIFIGALDQAIALVKTKDAHLLGKMNFNKAFIDGRFGTQRIAWQWQGILRALVEQYPTAETRGFASEMFIYRSS